MVTFRKRYRPEINAALSEVARINAIKWVTTQFVPMPESGLNLSERLSATTCKSPNGKPTVVFYTAEDAVRVLESSDRARSTSKLSNAPEIVEHPSAVASQRVYDEMIHPVDNRMACYYARYVNTLRIDVSKVTPEQDLLINTESAPLMVFFKADGTYVDHITSKLINERTFCQAVHRSVDAEWIPIINREVRDFQESLKDVERLAKELYVARAKLTREKAELAQREAREAARQRNSNRRTSTIDRTSGPSAIERRIEMLEEEVSDLDQRLKAKKEEMEV